MGRVSKYIATALIAVMTVLVCSCNPDAQAEVKHVEVDIYVEQVSAAFCKVTFETDAEAYYLAGIEQVREWAEPMTYSKQFMNLTLDSAYMEYIKWRHSLLLDGVEHVADFCDHSLQYCDATIYFQFLEPDTEYWVFAFIVNKETNKPVGPLKLITIRTAAEGQVPVYFDYRVNGRWDYGYPLDENGSVLNSVPWVIATMDSADLREMGARVPGEFFADTFAIISHDRKARVLYGVYGHNNDGYGDGTSTTYFEVGHTYYTGMASLDGPILSGTVPKYYSIYRFRWEGDSTQIYFSHEKDDTRGAW